MAHAPGELPVPGYELVKVLGRGGFGEVWLAHGPGGIPAALKIVDLTARQALKELRAIHRVKTLNHPNLVPLRGLWLKNRAGVVLEEHEREFAEASLGTDSFDQDGETVIISPEDLEPTELILAMGLCEQSLSQRLQECVRAGYPGIPADELLGYMEDAARGIDYLNCLTQDLEDQPRSVQHCDIKPGNLLIVGGSVQVCDFGLARILQDGRTTAPALTAAYAPPELIAHNRPSAATDQYSLAVSYLELRTGELPFDGASYLEIAKIHTESKIDLSSLPADEQIVLNKALSKKPEERFSSAGEFVRVLRTAYANSSENRDTSYGEPLEQDTGATTPLPWPTENLPRGQQVNLAALAGGVSTDPQKSADHSPADRAETLTAPAELSSSDIPTEVGQAVRSPEPAATVIPTVTPTSAATEMLQVPRVWWLRTTAIVVILGGLCAFAGIGIGMMLGDKNNDDESPSAGNPSLVDANGAGSHPENPSAKPVAGSDEPRGPNPDSLPPRPGPFPFGRPPFPPDNRPGTPPPIGPRGPDGGRHPARDLHRQLGVIRDMAPNVELPELRATIRERFGELSETSFAELNPRERAQLRVMRALANFSAREPTADELQSALQALAQLPPGPRLLQELPEWMLITLGEILADAHAARPQEPKSLPPVWFLLRNEGYLE